MDADVLRIVLVAGEASGDELGAGLIHSLRKQYSGRLEICGVAGPAMQQAGCEAWFDSNELAVMGLVEVLRHLPRLLRLRRKLKKKIAEFKPHIYVGIDAPDFNLPLEKYLYQSGCKTVHYVSPSVWAWRPQRAARMADCCDSVLCLLPFEPDFYKDYGVDAVFVGHPLADRIATDTSKTAARERLGLPAEGELVALLPGSRGGEIDRLGADFARTAALMTQNRPGLRFVAAMANPAIAQKFAALLAQHAPVANVKLLDGQAQQAIAAADVTLLASGTATLEALLLKRPMVVAYKLAQTSRIILERFKLLNIERFSLPNLLADRPIVAEVLQDEVTPQRLAQELQLLLDRPDHSDYIEACEEIHATLRQDANARAAEAVLRVLGVASS
ncbi:MAG: lipid-A-disaccharide synthase [Gammaproteobacteria bacterium]|nr:lipid-A-disaccharide synthase [Gammaproteobacteria bacterium]